MKKLFILLATLAIFTVSLSAFSLAEDLYVVSPDGQVTQLTQSAPCYHASSTAFGFAAFATEKAPCHKSKSSSWTLPAKNVKKHSCPYN